MANRVHFPSLASFEDVEVVAACDIDDVRLSETAKRWGIHQTFADYREMVESVQPEAVYAIGQPHVMYDIWVWCLNQGCNLYIEKPLGLTLHQARDARPPRGGARRCDPGEPPAEVKPAAPAHAPGVHGARANHARGM